MKWIAGVLCLASALGCGAGTDYSIVAMGRENSSGTYTYFKEHVLGGEDFAGAVEALPGTAAMVNAVMQDHRSLGYGGMGYLKGVRALRVKKDDSSPSVEPTPENILKKSYPLSRDLYFYTVGEPEGVAKHFVDWVRSSEGQKICAEVGYIPLPDGQHTSASGAPPAGKQTLTIKGSDTMVILGGRWAERYMQAHPDCVLQVTGGGSETGIKALMEGETNICQASRPLKPKEKEQIKAKFGKDPVETTVAMDGLAIFVNEKNPLQEISLADLKGIYTGKINRWGELGKARP